MAQYWKQSINQSWSTERLGLQLPIMAEEHGSSPTMDSDEEQPAANLL